MNIKRLYMLYGEGGMQEVRRGIFDYLRRNTLCQIGPKLPSESVWNRKWDILCVLDGCRLDTFRNTIDEDCDRLRSVGSTSQTWIPRTFDSHDVSEVAYVTGNPYSMKTDTTAFDHYHEFGVTEIEGIETVPPEELTDYAIRIWRKRDELGFNELIVHYMQPHVPFRARPEWFEEWLDTDTWGSSTWRRLRTDEISRNEFFAAYRDNLEWVWQDGVTRLSENCDGKIAVTADHGNAAGELGFYAHPRGAPVPSVRHVPWKTLSGNDTGAITPDVSVEDNHNERDVEESSKALGYR